VENYGEVLDQVNYVQTFRFLKLKYEQNQERFKERSTIETVPALLRTNRFRRDPRQLDEDEEMWFNDEDDIEDGEAVVPGNRSPPEMLNRKIDDELDTIGKNWRVFFCFMTRWNWDINVNFIPGKLLDKKAGESVTSPRSMNSVVTSLSPNRSPTPMNSNSITVSSSTSGVLNANNSANDNKTPPVPSKVCSPFSKLLYHCFTFVVQRLVQSDIRRI